MHFRWVNPASRLPNALEAWCVLLLLGGSFYMYRAMQAGLDGPVASGFVGPFRGGTRAAASLIRGHVHDALTYNPLAVALILVVVVGAARWLLLALPLGQRPQCELSRRGRWIGFALALVAISLGWVYVLVSQSYLRPFAS